MDSTVSPGRRNLLEHLQGLLKAGAGGLVIASATVTTTPAEASTSSTANRPTITRRIEEIRNQVGPATSAADTPGSGPLLAWGNWHNGWPNGWHNWRNWRNW